MTFGSSSVCGRFSNTGFRRSPDERERGQVIVLVVVMFVVLLGFGALVIDIGSWYLGKRQAQAAADAGALAGAQYLPSDFADATSMAQSYVTKNLSDAQATITPGYSGNPNQIEVKVHINRPSFFAGIFGIHTVGINMRAVATSSGGTTPAAIFAYNSSCGNNQGLSISGSSETIGGAIISNGNFNVSGGSNYAGYATAGGPSSCAPKISGTGNRFPTNGTPASHTDLIPWPAYFTTSNFTCNFSAANFTFSTSNVTIPSGVYCATNKISVTGGSIKGNVTFIAPNFSISSSNSVFTPYQNGVLWFDTGTQDFSFSGSNNNWTGIIFDPNGTADLTGSALSSYNGMVEALNVNLTGSNWAMTGTGPAVGGGGIELIQ